MYYFSKLNWITVAVCSRTFAEKMALKSGRHLSILCVNRVPWNVSHTEDSQLLGAPVQKKLPGQCCTQDVGTSVIVTLELAEV